VRARSISVKGLFAMTLLRGMGIAIYFGGTGTVNNCTLSNNYITDIVSGGGASVQSGSSASFTGCTFGNNTGGSGAGVYVAVGLQTAHSGIESTLR